MLAHTPALVAATASAAFNLTCTGLRVETDRYSQPAKVQQATPYVSHLRIDAETKRWCNDECTVVMPLVSLSPSMIVLSAIHAEGNSATGQIDLIHKHMSAAITETRGPDRVAAKTTWEGECVQSTFTGFPPA